MISANVKIINKDEVEQFKCKGLELVTCFVVKKGMKSGRNSVIMRFKHGPEFFEFETSSNLMTMMGNLSKAGENNEVVH